MDNVLIEVRKWWMQLYGLSDKEIERSIIDSPPVSIEDEIEQLHAIFDVRSMNNEYSRKMRSYFEKDVGDSEQI
jgi:hypothetical protein